MKMILDGGSVTYGCHICHGAGIGPDDRPCPNCGGSGMVSETDTGFFEDSYLMESMRYLPRPTKAHITETPHTLEG